MVRPEIWSLKPGMLRPIHTGAFLRQIGFKRESEPGIPCICLRIFQSPVPVRKNFTLILEGRFCRARLPAPAAAALSGLNKRDASQRGIRHAGSAGQAAALAVIKAHRARPVRRPAGRQAGPTASADCPGGLCSPWCRGACRCCRCCGPESSDRDHVRRPGNQHGGRHSARFAGAQGATAYRADAVAQRPAAGADPAQPARPISQADFSGRF